MSNEVIVALIATTPSRDRLRAVVPRPPPPPAFGPAHHRKIPLANELLLR
jgi:hypothetical protein